MYKKTAPSLTGEVQINLIKIRGENYTISISRINNQEIGG